MFAAISFAAFIFKNDNLFCFALFNDMSLNRGIIENRLADIYMLTVGNHQYMVKSYRSTDLTGDLFNP